MPAPTPSRRRLPQSVKSGIRSVSSGYGQSTRALRTLPTFLIVGAQRCGTTSLFKALVQHPRVHGPVLRKGVHYFDTQYERGAGFYRGHFPLRRSVRTGPEGSGDQVGESSPYYLFHPLAAERIARDLPGVRVLVMLRDPVERAYSAHVHETARGYETEPFARALELEESRLRGEEERLAEQPGAYSFSHQHHAYLARGHYIDQLARLERHLGRDRMHVVASERFFAAPEEVFPEVEDFLGVPHHSGISFERHNARPRTGMDPVLRTELAAHFARDDERLAQWWRRTPVWRARSEARG